MFLVLDIQQIVLYCLDSIYYVLNDVLYTLYPSGQVPIPSGMEAFMALLFRNALGARKCPAIDLKSAQRKFIYNNNVGILPIGIKPDNKTPEGNEML